MKGKQKSALLKLQCREEKDGVCQKCEFYSKELHVDHIFPASLLHAWGLKDEASFDADNLQLLCKSCGILKSNRFDFHNPKTIPLIEKYIELLKQTYKTKI